MAVFRDRRDAGRKLAQHLTHYTGRPDLLILALPRGGVPVAFEVTQALNAPLDIYLVRKLGVPGDEELAMGAIASGKTHVLNNEVIADLHIPASVVEAVARREGIELERRERAYRGDRPPPDVSGRTVILIDDGLATGSSMRAAVAGLRTHEPAHIAVAVPIASPDTCEALRTEVDDVVCAVTPQPLIGVGLWYDDFTQTSDEEVRQLLAEADAFLRRGTSPRNSVA